MALSSSSQYLFAQVYRAGEPYCALKPNPKIKSWCGLHQSLGSNIIFRLKSKKNHRLESVPDFSIFVFSIFVPKN